MKITHGFHATMTAQPGKADELIAALLTAPSLPNDDCIVFLVGRSASNPDVVHVTEGWSTEEAHSRFFNSEQAKAFTARIQQLVADSEYADEIPVGGKAAL
ncbi:antibiotic biosynthesis monooxygenase family protein [Kribbella sp. NPDC051718]|uniref:putative quinol monooxygenase n=1 Tax=Kribbella sp. NPDC051718 TaxID=3155168 RepID=UPI0034450831